MTDKEDEQVTSYKIGKGTKEIHSGVELSPVDSNPSLVLSDRR